MLPSPPPPPPPHPFYRTKNIFPKIVTFPAASLKKVNSAQIFYETKRRRVSVNPSSCYDALQTREEEEEENAHGKDRV